jgi:hypothetical protein
MVTKGVGTPTSTDEHGRDSCFINFQLPFFLALASIVEVSLGLASGSPPMQPFWSGSRPPLFRIAIPLLVFGVYKIRRLAGFHFLIAA